MTIYTGVLQPANGRAELRLEGEVFSLPARFSGQRVTIEVEPALPDVVARASIPGVRGASSTPAGVAPAVAVAQATQQDSTSGLATREPLRRVFDPEDLEVLGT